MKVDKKVPVGKIKSGRKAKYPFGTMEVGDSVLFDGEKLSSSCKPYSAARSHGEYTGKRFIGRTVDGGVRIWRVE